MVSIMTNRKKINCIIVFSLLLLMSITEANFSTVRQFPSGVTFHNDVEHYGHWPWRFHYALHQWGLGDTESKHDEKRFVVFGTEEDFHTYGVMIDEEYIILNFDGVELHREQTPESVKTALYPLVNLALGPGWPTDKTPNPSYMYVDYIKVRKKVKGPAK